MLSIFRGPFRFLFFLRVLDHIHLCNWSADCSPKMKYPLNGTTCLPLDESVLLFLSTASSVCYAAVVGEA